MPRSEGGRLPCARFAIGLRSAEFCNTLFLVQYTWDRTKAASNLKKHGVSFEEAVTAVEHPDARAVPDLSNADEQRLNVTGWSERARLLFVVCIEIVEDHVRIISARPATRAESRAYDEEQNW